MISGVIFLLAGEAAILRSMPHLVWTATFIAITHRQRVASACPAYNGDVEKNHAEGPHWSVGDSSSQARGPLGRLAS